MATGETIDVNNVCIPEIDISGFIQGSVSSVEMNVDFGDGMTSIGRGNDDNGKPYDIDLNEEEVTMTFPDGTVFNINEMIKDKGIS